MDSLDSKSGIDLLKTTRRCRGIDKYVSSSVGLSIDEMHCLSALFTDRPQSVKRLSELISVSPTQTSKILKSLELQGYLSRRMDPDDRRKEQVVLTESGTRAVQEILSLFTEVGGQLSGTWHREGAVEYSVAVPRAGHSPKADNHG